MKQQTRRIAGWIILAGMVVFLLSVLFSALILRGLSGNRQIPGFLQWLSGEQAQNTEASTTQSPLQTAANPSPTPSEKCTPEPVPTTDPVVSPAISEPAASPTPVPTATPMPTTGPAPTQPPETDDPLAPYRIIESIYEQISPAVVGIRVKVPASGMQPVRTNEGSGLLIDEKGFVVTQAGLFEIAMNRQGALLPDVQIDILVQGTERVFAGELVGQDQTTRCAVIKIDDVTKPFDVPSFSDLQAMQTGRMVLSIGFPDLLESSGGLSTGFITSLDYPILLEDGTAITMLEADLMMTQRSFGGPVLNLQGDVIALSGCGINGEPYSSNIHAMSIDSVLQVADHIMNQVQTDQTWLGVAVLDPDRFLNLQQLYDYPDGLYIAAIVPDSPAYIANLRRGDIIVAINDVAVSPTTPVSQYLEDQPVGTALEMEIYRHSEDELLSVRAYLQRYGP